MVACEHGADLSEQPDGPVGDPAADGVEDAVDPEPGHLDAADRRRRPTAPTRPGRAGPSPAPPSAAAADEHESAGERREPDGGHLSARPGRR